MADEPCPDCAVTVCRLDAGHLTQTECFVAGPAHITDDAMRITREIRLLSG